MRIRHLFQKSAKLDSRLFGRWCIQQLPDDIPAEDEITEFRPDGSMIVTKHESRTSISHRRYSVESGFLISRSVDSPSSTTVRTPYHIALDGSLILTCEKWEWRYIQLKKEAQQEAQSNGR
jgi:hypothetical protein